MARRADRRRLTDRPAPARSAARRSRCSRRIDATTAAQTAPAPGQPPGALDVHFSGQLIEEAGEATNVWDMERVAHANTLPFHWNYIHMGVDDLETRVANREGFQRLALKPRRIGPDAKLDTSTTLFGRRGARRCSCARWRRSRRTTPKARPARPARRKARGVLQIQSHQSSQSYETIAEARGEPHWFQLYANPDWDITRKTLDKVKARGCPVLVWTVDLLGGSNRELSRRSQGREGYERPLCQSCHNHQKGYQRPMHRDVSGPPGPRTAVRLGLRQAAARRDADEDRAQGHRHPRGSRAVRPARRRRGVRLEPRRPRREQPARQHRLAARRSSPASRAGCR